MRFFDMFVGAALAVASTFASEYAPGVVHVLKEDNFDDFLGKTTAALVKFYAPWCGHCKRMAQDYEDAAKLLAKDDISVLFGKVDATEENALARRFQVQGYPTLKFYKAGSEFEYDGPRDAEGIADWVRMYMGPAVTMVDSCTAEKVVSSNIAFCGEFSSEESEAFKAFASVADSNRRAAKFFAVSGAAAEKVIAKRADEPDVVAEKLDAESLKTFVAEESFPLFGPVSGENFARYHERKLDLVWFPASADTYREIGAAVREVAKRSDLRSEYSMVWLDTETFASHARDALGVHEYPAVVIQKQTGRFIHTGAFTAEALNQFFDDVKAGKIQRTIKSEPIPEDNSAPVKVVVADNFENLVLDEKKDVLLEVYAPWCGHCQRLQPIYDELGELLRKTGAEKSVTIAKMDGTANESPVPDFDWTGFPTLFWVPAGAQKPVKYTGGRDLESFKKWIMQHSTDAASVAELLGSEKEDKEAAEGNRDEL